MYYLKSIIWAVASFLILVSGIVFTFFLKFPQFKIKKLIKNILKKEENSGISSFAALMLTLGGRIGVGSISGVAISIYYGGVGTIFWMWFFALLGSATTMAETILGLIYKNKNVGGPSYYLEKGLNNKALGKLYAVLILISYIGGFLSIQTNTIVTSLKSISNFNVILISTLLILMITPIIFGGIKKITEILNKIVPFMTLLYLLLTIFIIYNNIEEIPNLFLNIFKSAFSFRPFISGFMVQVITGLQRGIFSNESGIGTSVISSSTVDSKDYVKQGYMQILGIFITTFLICTSTAIIILCSDYINLDLESLNGIEIVSYSFKYHFNNFGSIILFIFVFLFSLSTIFTGYYYGETSFKYLSKNDNKSIFYLKIITLIVLFLGCIIKANILWDFIDILVGLLTIINIYALLKLKDVVKKNT